MPRSTRSRERGARERPASDVDARTLLLGALRDARLARDLSQQALAHRLGLHQRQISDLERGAMDPRLSTIQNVGRALDLELMLVPRHLINTVLNLQRSDITASGDQPMYPLDDDDAEPDDGTGGDPR